MSDDPFTVENKRTGAVQLACLTATLKLPTVSHPTQQRRSEVRTWTLDNPVHTPITIVSIPAHTDPCHRLRTVDIKYLGPLTADITYRTIVHLDGRPGRPPCIVNTRSSDDIKYTNTLNGCLCRADDEELAGRRAPPPGRGQAPPSSEMARAGAAAARSRFDYPMSRGAARHGAAPGR